MATEFKDLDDFFDSSLRLPVGGKVYVIASPDHKVGLYVQRIVEAVAIIEDGGMPTGEAPKLVLDDGEEVDLYESILGPTFQQMKDDGVPWAKQKMVANTAFIWVAMGDEAAKAFWESGGDPKAASRMGNRSQRRATGSTRTGAASTTRKPASTSGTKRPSRSTKR